MKRQALWGVAGLVALAACQSPAPQPMAPGDLPPAECGADRLQGRIGAPLSRFDEADWPTSHRVEAPGSLQTMDFRPERLRIQTDASGTITALLCG